MNRYCQNALNQLQVAINSIIEMVDMLDQNDLQKKPSINKFSIGELLEHIATICRADYYISNSVDLEEMTAYYSTVSLTTKEEIKEALANNYTFLQERFMQFDEEELHEEMTSYWGTTYSRYEWLVEIVAHLYHHRGQLHSMLVHCYSMDLKVQLFE